MPVMNMLDISILLVLWDRKSPKRSSKLPFTPHGSLTLSDPSIRPATILSWSLRNIQQRPIASLLAYLGLLTLNGFVLVKV
jgi:hypothetical protein